MQYRLLLIATVALACRSPNVVEGNQSAQATATAAVSPNAHDHVAPVSRGPLPGQELEKARKATARYQDVENARADGYVDIKVVLPNMGRHFLKESQLDATFDAERPELLVYKEEPGGLLTLVALEYAVPLNLSATAPEGFTGGRDGWFADQTFHLWTLHAWVWRANPEGVFHATNRLVP